MTSGFSENNITNFFFIFLRKQDSTFHAKKYIINLSSAESAQSVVKVSFMREKLYKIKQTTPSCHPKLVRYICDSEQQNK